MNRLAVFFVPVVVIFLLDLSLAFAKDTVAGKWKITVTQGENSRDYDLELEQDEEKVKGVLISPRSGKYPFEGGTFRDGKLDVTVPRRFGERIVQFQVSVRLQEDGSLSGDLIVDGRASGKLKITRRGEQAQKPAEKQAKKVSLAGRWNVTSKSADESQSWSSKLTVTEDRKGGLKGSAETEVGTADIRNPKLTGERFSFELTLDFDGTLVDFVIRATFKDANTLAGRWMWKENQEISGEWNAKRQAPVARPAAKAKVERWRARAELPDGETVRFGVELRRSGDSLSGTVRFGGKPSSIREAKMDGDRFEFRVDLEWQGQTYDVKIEGRPGKEGRLRGKWSTTSGEEGEWSARKPAVL